VIWSASFWNPVKAESRSCCRSAWPHGGFATHVLSRHCGHHGGGPGAHAGFRSARTALWRLLFNEPGRLCHSRAPDNLDINDFDETAPGPCEWDVRCLAASFVLACRSNGFAASDQRDVAMACLRSYREHMREYSEAPVLETWYSSVDLSNELAAIHTKAVRARLNKRVQKRTGAQRFRA
jgi:hypothetical protein